MIPGHIRTWDRPREGVNENHYHDNHSSSPAFSASAAGSGSGLGPDSSHGMGWVWGGAQHSIDDMIPCLFLSFSECKYVNSNRYSVFTGLFYLVWLRNIYSEWFTAYVLWPSVSWDIIYKAVNIIDCLTVPFSDVNSKPFFWKGCFFFSPISFFSYCSIHQVPKEQLTATILYKPLSKTL